MLPCHLPALLGFVLQGQGTTFRAPHKLAAESHIDQISSVTLPSLKASRISASYGVFMNSFSAGRNVYNYSLSAVVDKCPTFQKGVHMLERRIRPDWHSASRTSLLSWDITYSDSSFWISWWVSVVISYRSDIYGPIIAEEKRIAATSLRTNL